MKKGHDEKGFESSCVVKALDTMRNLCKHIRAKGFFKIIPLSVVQIIPRVYLCDCVWGEIPNGFMLLNIYIQILTQKRVPLGLISLSHLKVG